MKIILTSIEADLADAWERWCGDLPDVEIHRGSILEIASDAIVSPANSFGFMDGGIDLVYSRYFGWDLQYRLQARIMERHHGELLVGAAEIVETGDDRIPYMIAAPTMRVPMVLENSVNPYLAARAVLLLATHGEFMDGEYAGTPIRDTIETIAFPGMGTGVGKIGPNTCAYQMRQAIEEVVLGQARYPSSWAEAVRRHTEMIYGMGG